MPMASEPPSFPVLLYDGDCAFCSTSVRLIRRWVPTEGQLIPWQFADLDAVGLSAEACDAAVQWASAPARHDPMWP